MEHTPYFIFGFSLLFLLYWGVAFFLLKSLRLNRVLKARWSQFSAGNLKEFQKNPGIYTHKLMDSENFLNNLLKKIEHFLYRGGLPASSLVHTLGVPFLLIFLYIVFLFSQFSITFKIFLPLFITAFIYFGIVWVREKIWKKKFTDGFATALDLISRGLKSGLTLIHGIELAAKETEGPIQHAFKTLTTQLHLGIPLDKALHELAIKIDLDDFQIFALGLTIQKETGGSLVEILDKLSSLIRDRDHFDKKLKALTAEGKTTAKILGAMPFLVWGVAATSNKDYINFFIYTHDGQIMLVLSLILSFIGIVVINRMSSLEV